MTIILLVVGFLVLLIFLGNLALKGQIGNQVCHFTVVLRGSFPEIIPKLTFSESIPLKCKTEKICVTADDDCGRYGHKLIKISGREEEQKTRIKYVLANEMVRCWRMMGEGNVQVFDRKLIKNEGRGVICSRIMFDDSIKIEEIPVLEMVQYLINHGPSEDESFWEILSKEGAFTKDQGERIRKLIKKNPSYPLKSERAVLFMQTTPSNFYEFLSAIGVGVAGGVGGAKLGGAIGVLAGPPGVIVGVGVGATTGWFVADAVQEKIDDDDDDVWSGVYLTEYSSEALRKLGVTSLENHA